MGFKKSGNAEMLGEPIDLGKDSKDQKVSDGEGSSSEEESEDQQQDK